ncbi:MAG: histidinol-phosphate transaminase [Haloarculaceae archaeon]
MEPRDLSAHAVYRAGHGVEETARELGMDPAELVKLSSNENPFGPSPAAVEVIRERAPETHTYPKAVHADLVAAIAERWSVADEQVWLGAGGDGVIDYLGRAFLADGDGVLHPEPGFAYYPMSARYHGGVPRTYTLEKAADFDQTADVVLESYDGERIIYVTTPHNPTGAEMSLVEIEGLAAATGTDTLLVVDEAYGEFGDAESARTLLDEREDVAILRTFSKAYGLAGLRLGYALVPAGWADAYARVNTPFAVSSLACSAGLAALEDEDHVDRTVETAAWARDYMREHLAVRTWPSGGNFVLAEVGDAERVTQAAKRAGVIVRDCSSFGLPACVRITCGTREETRQAVDVLNEVAPT